MQCSTKPQNIAAALSWMVLSVIPSYSFHFMEYLLVSKPIEWRRPKIADPQSRFGSRSLIRRSHAAVRASAVPSNIFRTSSIRFAKLSMLKVSLELAPPASTAYRNAYEPGPPTSRSSTTVRMKIRFCNATSVRFFFHAHVTMSQTTSSSCTSECVR